MEEHQKTVIALTTLNSIDDDPFASTLIVLQIKYINNITNIEAAARDGEQQVEAVSIFADKTRKRVRCRGYGVNTLRAGGASDGVFGVRS